MNPTTQKRRPISIYDYPEHLNPFSQCHLHFPVPQKRNKNIIVDKSRTNGINGNSQEKSKLIENSNKFDTKRRKKRPAPLPPNIARTPSVIERPIVKECDREIKVTNGECKLEEKIQNEVSIPHDEKIETEPVHQETKSTAELPNEKNVENVPRDDSSTKVEESKLTDRIENLQIENDAAEQSKQNSAPCSEHDVVKVESNESQENIIEMHLDENDNISSVKIENENIIDKNNPKVTLLAAENEIRNP